MADEGMDGPLITPIQEKHYYTLIGVFIGISTFGCIALLAICYYYHQGRRDRLKRQGSDQPLAFHSHRRPTAVKSPAGSGIGGTTGGSSSGGSIGTHYLKKSPSPTGISKTPPGVSVPHTPSPSGTNGMIGPLENGVLNHHQHEKKLDNQIGRDLCISENERHTPTEEEQEINEKNLQRSVAYMGQLVFKLRHRNDRNALIVSVVRCKDLPAKDINTGSSDPYVKLQLLPDKQHKVKTRVLRRTRNPVYDEDFTFYGIGFNQLSNITLHFVVLSFDRYSRDDIIGEVFCALNTVDLAQIETQQMALTREIQPRNLKIRNQGRGELLVSLCWQPAANRLTIVILKASNLPKMDLSGLSDPYVKIYLLLNGQRISKKKTHVKKRTLNPVFNESFVFDIPATANSTDSLDGISLEFLLLDWDRVTRNEVIGRLELGGANCTGSALQHWYDMRNSPRRQIAVCHKLKE